MPFYQIPKEFLIFRLERIKIDAGTIAAHRLKFSCLVEHVCDTPCHACRKVPAGRAKDNNRPTSHVFTPMIADRFHDCRGA